MSKKLFKRENVVTTCNNHISGLLGEALLRFFLKEKLIKKTDDTYLITDSGWEELELIGIDVTSLKSKKGNILSICIESDHGILFEHIGSHLGALLIERMIELEWLEKYDGNRFQLTEKGEVGLESLGVKIKN